MPELAEVEYNRRQWDPGLRAKVGQVHLREGSRVSRFLSVPQLKQHLPGARLVGSEAFGKRMCFRFTGGSWLGIHLGMTGRLHAEGPDFKPSKHDHLVLRQRTRCLVFSDPRQFGRLDFHHGSERPAWWSEFPPALISSGFTVAGMTDFLKRHGRLSLKAALLLQDGFPGLGNWMVDETLWQARLSPCLHAGKLTRPQSRRLWRAIRHVCSEALRTVAKDYSDPPEGWLFHERWNRKGKCPRHGVPLRFDTVGGRTTVWCPRCQGA